MYSLPHWIAIIRLFGYAALPMDQARQAIKPTAEEFGKEPVASACEALVEISTKGKTTFARLKAHVRRMAFQILGPEPSPGAHKPSVTSAPAAPSRDTEPASPPPPERKTRKKPVKPSAPPPPTTTNPQVADGQPAIMQQYRAAKEKHPDMMIVFRVGDFFELFGEDAEAAHKLLGLTLTTRDQNMLMAGFPHHQLETYLHKLLKEGQRVAVCESVEDSLVRGPIRREITRVVTPGAMEEDDAPNTMKRQATRNAPVEGRAVRQPRHFVLKQFEAWLNQASLAFVAVDDVRRTTPAIAPHVGALDFIVLRGDEKLLVTVRPHLQAKHLKAFSELQTIFGPEYQPMRIWPTEGPDGWIWQDHPVDVSAAHAS
jgi:hypothetical protein